MAQFSYVAQTAGGDRSQGRIDAEDEAAAARTLTAAGLTVVGLTPAAHRSLKALLATELRLSNGLPPRLFLSLIREWATLVGAGLPLHAALELSRSGRKGPAARMVADLLEAVRGGQSLQAALKASGQFPGDFVALVGAAEASASLGPALRGAAEQADARQKLAQKLRKELIYPAFLTVTASVAIIVLLTVVVPNIEDLIDGAGATHLPLATRLVIAVSHALRDWGLSALAVTAIGAGLLGAGLATAQGKRIGARLLVGLPLIGRVLLLGQVARYLDTLAALVAGGVGLARAQGLAVETLSNGHIRHLLDPIAGEISGGRSLSSALAAAGPVPEEAIGLIRSGEQTGQLAAMLRAAGGLLQARTDQRLELLATLLGPVLTIVFGLVAGMIVYVMLTSILSINEFAFR